MKKLLDPRHASSSNDGLCQWTSLPSVSKQGGRAGKKLERLRWWRRTPRREKVDDSETEREQTFIGLLLWPRHFACTVPFNSQNNVLRSLWLILLNCS